ncbi:MAG: Gfo/Idh/MocA family oxidoreductase [Bacteroidia bacterium]|nr:Gfo/Idh/MocA family oxidoreductase [Bacteroidia bacterium]
MPKISRRSFLQSGTVAAAALTVVPNTVLGKSHGHIAPADKLNVAGVGIGGRGKDVLKGLESQNIVALCDIDWKYAKPIFERYPGAKPYWDYRKMFDEMGKSIDAVMVATADHTHALITADAITMGKHVYTEKPLTHSVYESRLLTKLAAKYQIASQMGNHGSSGEGVNLTCDWIWNGEIGEVTKVEAYTNRPVWPQGLMTPSIVDKIPASLNWDLFTGPAEMRPYNTIYHPWNWRGWWAYGTGALGDMACHILHPVFKSLKLSYPTKAQGSSTLLLKDCAPNAQHVRLTFPARDNMPKVAMPEVEVHWYDGGMKPDMPAGWPAGKNMNNQGGGVIFHGTKDTLICGCYGVEPWLLSGRVPDAPKVSRRVEGNENRDTAHFNDFIRACKESASSRVKTASDFSEAGPFNEMVVMGVLAVRLQTLNKELLWDGPNMRLTNITDDETLQIVVNDTFAMVDGRPKFDKKSTDPMNAKKFAEDLIKHNYREGWKLVDMPV